MSIGFELFVWLDLLFNDVVDGIGYVVGQGSLVVSLDGIWIVFIWCVKCGNGWDIYVFIVKLDGSDLCQMMVVVDVIDLLGYVFGSFIWLFDGQWLVFVLYMNGVMVVLVWFQDIIGVVQVIGMMGCDVSLVYVLLVG